MYDYLEGTIVEKGLNDVVIDVAGVGYYALASTTTLSDLTVGQVKKLFVKLLVKEDDHSLCAFSQRREREFFTHLIGVSGIGQRVAMNMISQADYSDILLWIISADEKKLTKLPGLGKKTAQRLIVELKDKFVKQYGASLPDEVAADAIKITQPSDEVLLALSGLGFQRDEIKLMLQGIDTSTLTVEEAIKYALKR